MMDDRRACPPSRPHLACGMPVTPSPLLRFTPWLALVAFVLTGCFREVTDESGIPPRPRYTGTALWTIDGARPGDTFDELKARLGEPHSIREYSGLRTVTWKYGQILVTFDATGHATEVTGQSIRAGTDTLITTGDREAEAVQVLGKGETKKGFTPGSFVISLWGKHTSTEHVYDNAGVNFEVMVKQPDATVLHLWARLPKPERR